MAAWTYLVLLNFLISNVIYSTNGVIIEVTNSNIDTVRRDSPFLLLYMTTRECKKCLTLFPKFMAASQPFKDDPDIAFGRVNDDKLAAEFNVNKFPSFVFLHKGTKEPYLHQGDISVDTITELVARRMGGDFSTVRRQYATELTSSNFKSMTMIPNLYKILLLYKREHEEDLALFESLAKVHKNDDEILFLRMDIFKESRALSNFEAKTFPVMYWYSNDEKPEKVRYGGKMDRLQLKEFLKDQTGIQRTRTGDLPEDAGQIKEMDELITRNVKNINSIRNMKIVISQARKIAEYHKQKDLANYYVHLLEDIEDAQTLDIIDDERTSLNRAIAELSENSPKTEEALRRRRNIVLSIIDAIGLHLYGGKDSPIVKKRNQRRFDLQVDQEVLYPEEGKKEQKIKHHRKEHIHLHEEL